MRIYEIGTGYTSIPADKGAATEIVVENLSRALIAQGHDVTVVDIEDPHRLPTELPIVEVPMPKGFGATDEALGLRHKLKRVVYSVRLSRVLRRVLREAHERVVLHFHNQYNAYFFLRLTPRYLRGRALVCYTNHSYVWHDPWEKIEGTVRKRYFQEIYAMRHADAVFVLNERTERTVVDRLGIASSKVVRIANGIDVGTYRPLPEEERERAREELGLGGALPFIEVGSVCERKNQLEAVELLAPLMRKDPRVRFFYAGGVIDEDYQRRIGERARELGVEEKVFYLGEVAPGERLNRCYNAAVAMVFPAKAEGFSLCVLEALSAGLPVIVRDDLEMPLEGLLTYESSGEFEGLIGEKILDGQRLALESIQARATAMGYSWTAIALDYVRAFERVLSSGSREAHIAQEG